MDLNELSEILARKRKMQPQDLADRYKLGDFQLLTGTEFDKLPPMKATDPRTPGRDIIDAGKSGAENLGSAKDEIIKRGDASKAETSGILDEAKDEAKGLLGKGGRSDFKADFDALKNIKSEDDLLGHLLVTVLPTIAGRLLGGKTGARVGAQAGDQTGRAYVQSKMDAAKEAKANKLKEIESKMKFQDKAQQDLYNQAKILVDLAQAKATAGGKIDSQLIDRINGIAGKISDLELKSAIQAVSQNLTAVGLAVKKEGQDKKGAGKQYKDESALRKERSGLSDSFRKISAAYNKVQNAAKNPSAAGDISLIFNFMKILDPGSVVREGEFATAQNATGVPEQIRNKYNQIKEGERLGAKQRQDFLDQARNAYDAEQVNQRQLDVKYTEIAKTYGFDPSRVLLPFEAQDPNASDPKIAAYAKQFKLTYQQAEVILRKRGYVSKPE